MNFIIIPRALGNANRYFLLKNRENHGILLHQEMSKTWPKRKSVEGKQEQIAEQPAKKSAKTRRGMEPGW